MPRPQPVQPKPERAVAYIRFTPPLLDRIKAEAKRRRVSVNRLVEWGMEDWLDGRGAKS